MNGQICSHEHDTSVVRVASYLQIVKVNLCIERLVSCRSVNGQTNLSGIELCIFGFCDFAIVHVQGQSVPYAVSSNMIGCCALLDG